MVDCHFSPKFSVDWLAGPEEKCILRTTLQLTMDSRTEAVALVIQSSRYKIQKLKKKKKKEEEEEE